VVESTGMTLRDYFAAQAMPGILAMSHAERVTVPQAATYAYQLADAMLKERDK
jgi:hypothetical protein